MRAQSALLLLVVVYVRPDQCPSLHFALRRKWRTFVYVWVAPCSVDAGNRKRERDIVNSCKFEKILCCCCSSLKGSFEGGRAKMVMVGETIWKANSIEALPFTLTLTTTTTSNTCSHHSLVAFVSAATAATATSATASTNHPSPFWCVCIVLATAAAAAAVERKREPSPSIVSMS